MTKQGGLRVRVVVFKVPSRLPQIRDENFHRGQQSGCAWFTNTQQRFWGQASDWRRRVLAALRDLARGGSETKLMKRSRWRDVRKCERRHVGS